MTLAFRPLARAATLALLLPLAPLAQAACLSDTDAALMAARFASKTMLPAQPAGMTMQDAECSRDKVVGFLARDLGRVVGYKAGLTNPAVQKRFHHDAPVRGTLYEKMMVADGAWVDAKWGARPVFEADLIAVVKDSGIHGAKTPLEVLRHVSAIKPFIEMPDLAYEDPAKIDGPALVAANVAARIGVLGKAIAVQPTQQWVDALADMTVRLQDVDGKDLDSGKGSAILGNPLNAAIWLAADLKKSGITLKRGDLLSLGSFSKLLPPKAGGGARVVYEGLPGNPSVSVGFR